MQRESWRYFALFLIVSGFPTAAQIVPGRYTLILDDPPVAARYAARSEMRSAAAAGYRQQIQSRQQAMIRELTDRNFQVTGSASRLVNAIFVTAQPTRLAELAAIPGVHAVKPMRRFKPVLNAATEVANAPSAWTALGGAADAGKGIKIGVIDSGIDHTHPAFAKSDLNLPSGYPLCTSGHPEDCEYTNNKVVVARSYVRQMALAGVKDPSNPAAESQPDDYSPRDHMGHGTAVASVAAGESNTGTVTFTGIAPKAWLGNYKIAGSPGVNDGPTDDILIMAVEDALDDGMDVVNISWGSLALSDWASDPVTAAFENASAAGMVVVAAAGNEGDEGISYPFYSSISSPSNAPSAISVGASTNAHYFSTSVRATSANAPAALRNLVAQPGSSTFYPSQVGANLARLVDITSLGNDGLACAPLPAGSLTGAFALIKRGTCYFVEKAAFAQAAGAVGIIFYMADASTLLSPAADNFLGPVVMISLADGEALRSYLQTDPGVEVSIDLAGIENASTPNYLAEFSSRGPTPDGLLKPDLVAPGTGLYLAVQDYDPQGGMFSTNRYGTGSGTSFAAPIVAGAAALVQQAHTSWTPAQVRSALVNSTTTSVTMETQNGAPVDVRSTGAGLLNAGAAVSATLLAEPATLSFGAMSPGTLSGSKDITVRNAGTNELTLTAGVQVSSQAGGAQVAVTPASATVPPGGAATFNATLSGTTSVLGAGAYSGTISIASNSSAALRIPYLYTLTNREVAQIMPLMTVVQGLPGSDSGTLAVQATDINGVPVPDVMITFAASPFARDRFTLKSREGAPACTPASSTSMVACPTDNSGVAYAKVGLGASTGNYNVLISSGATSYSGLIRIMPPPTIGGIVDAASFQTTVAPGSYISVFGSDLIDTRQYRGGASDTARAPMSLDEVNVSFDATVNGKQVSYPGRLVYVSANQVNVLVPWELQGASSAQVKVIVNEASGPPSIYGNLYTLALSDHVPALFENGGVAAALDVNYGIISASNKATRGDIIQLYANGLGPVTNQPASGDPASSSPLSWTTTIPVVTIGGQNAEVVFHGLAPGFPALYQVNVRVPQDISAGTQPITVSIGGQTSKASTLPVQ